MAKNNGKYIYNSPTDQHLVPFLGFDPEAFFEELTAGKGGGEILEWVLSHSKTPRSPWEIYNLKGLHPQKSNLTVYRAPTTMRR